jgi:hypothetical protein
MFDVVSHSQKHNHNSSIIKKKRQSTIHHPPSTIVEPQMEQAKGSKLQMKEKKRPMDAEESEEYQRRAKKSRVERRPQEEQPNRNGESSQEVQPEQLVETGKCLKTVSEWYQSIVETDGVHDSLLCVEAISTKPGEETVPGGRIEEKKNVPGMPKKAKNIKDGQKRAMLNTDHKKSNQIRMEN